MVSVAMSRRRIESIIAGFFITAGMAGLAWILFAQESVRVSNGLGWDGVYYDRILRFLAAEGGSGSDIAFPYCVRVGTPWILVNILHNRLGFYGFNLIASVLFSAVLLFATRPLWRGSIKGLSAAMAASLFLYFAPIKFTVFYHDYMDPPFLLIMSCCLFFVLRRKLLIASLVCIAGIPFREASFYVLPLLVAFYIRDTERSGAKWLTGISIVAAGYVLKELMLLVTGCQSQSQLVTALFWFYRFISDPNHALASLAALSMTIGPLYVILDRQKVLEIKSDDAALFSTIAMVYCVILSIIGGSDVTRIFYSFIPLYVPLLIITFRESSITSFTLAFFGWLLTNHMLEPYQQPVSQGPNNDISGFFAQFPDYAHPAIPLVVLAIWIILATASRLIEPLERHLPNE
ncbi:hypothetical protein DPM33_28165 [Mesorhizobium hawassense]|uniref:Glycosyltransferase RgtA/B/C/D-like domain-containing protein n=1 Tax=Mesorhizobium hawassense TaxID=1209954 RepID=A0A330HAE1_9HYPH|nr:hypothetical protein [Mesorhizobium hawassense]RAZ85601.1 hypothetical protein DPM33_28165 [Mesorhizobium hawassense]